MDDYHYKNSNDYGENISENVPPESHLDAPPIDIDRVFETRQKIMRRGCKFLRHIQDLVTNPETTFDKLLEFHTFIHDIHIPIDKGMVILVFRPDLTKGLTNFDAP